MFATQRHDKHMQCREFCEMLVLSPQLDRQQFWRQRRNVIDQEVPRSKLRVDRMVGGQPMLDKIGQHASFSDQILTREIAEDVPLAVKLSKPKRQERISRVW